jgi:hypothetical protein
MAMIGMLAGVETARFIWLAWLTQRWLVPFWLAAVVWEPVLELWFYRHHGLSYFVARPLGGLRGAEGRGFEVSYWFEAMTNEEWKRMLEPLPEGSKVFLRPDHPGVPELVKWGVIPKHVTIVGAPEEAEYFLLYSKKAAYWTPSQDGKTMLRTNLADMQAKSQAIREVSFFGVRLASLHRQ